jgi:nicotinate-nucleotide adenylyltransferase
MRIGIMGGTFDPIHQGHLLVAERARLEANFDQVWFIPTHIPPHKKQLPRATNAHRWNMIVLAIASNPYFKAIDEELNKPSVSYSIETIETLRGQFPTHEFTYVIGADMLAYLPKWYRIEQLMQHVQFLVVSRTGYTLTLDHMPPEMRQRISLLSMPLIDISSTQIRASFERKAINRYALPEQVYAYIKEHHLYES